MILNQLLNMQGGSKRQPRSDAPPPPEPDPVSHKVHQPLVLRKQVGQRLGECLHIGPVVILGGGAGASGSAP